MPSLLEQAQQIAQQNQVTPDTTTFDESQGVEGRVNRITTSGSPLMESADTAGKQAAASRGLVNSTLAGQASQKAVIDAATPIATADAGMYQQTSLANLAAKNAAKSQNATAGVALGGQALGLENSNTQQEKTLAQQQAQFNVNAGQNQQQIDAQVEQFKQSLQQRASEFGTTAEQQQQQINNQVAQFSQKLAQDQTLAQLDADTRLKLGQLQTDSQKDIAGNENISQAWGSMMNAISQIQNNPNLEQAAKQTLIQNNIDAFAGFTNFWKKVSGGTIDVSDLLNFSAVGTTSSGNDGTSNPGYTNPPSPGNTEQDHS